MNTLSELGRELGRLLRESIQGLKEERRKTKKSQRRNVENNIRLTEEEKHVLTAIRNWVEIGEPATWDSVPDEEKPDVESLVRKGLVRIVGKSKILEPTQKGWSYRD